MGSKSGPRSPLCGSNASTLRYTSLTKMDVVYLSLSRTEDSLRGFAVRTTLKLRHQFIDHPLRLSCITTAKKMGVVEDVVEIVKFPSGLVTCGQGMGTFIGHVEGGWQ